MEMRYPTQHRMTRRAAAHDYSRPGLYHITMHVAEAWGQPLGAVVGELNAPDGSVDAPRVALSAAGKMVEHELLTAITSRYPMITIQDYVIMPEHLHCLIVVQDTIISQNGKHQPLGQVIAGFKKGCNKRYWEMASISPAPAEDATPTGGATPAEGAGGQTAAHTSTTANGASGEQSGAASFASGQAGGGQTAPHSVPNGANSVPSGFPAGYKVSSSGTTGRQPLFSPGYCDVMPVDEQQLATQRAYITGNPRSRLLRMSNRNWLMPRRMSSITTLTPSALRGYLLRECPPHLATPEALAAIENQLLITAGTAPSGLPAGKSYIACDTFGNSSLLTKHRCLPVVCHRKDEKRFADQQHRCLKEAAQGAVLVSACISPREREIIKEAVNHGFPVITIYDNGFSDRYHPSTDRLDLCARGRLLLATPWRYLYRSKEDNVTVPFCKTMNCVAQALCRTRDDWWK